MPPHPTLIVRGVRHPNANANAQAQNRQANNALSKAAIAGIVIAAIIVVVLTILCIIALIMYKRHHAPQRAFMEEKWSARSTNASLGPPTERSIGPSSASTQRSRHLTQHSGPSTQPSHSTYQASDASVLAREKLDPLPEPPPPPPPPPPEPLPQPQNTPAELPSSRCPSPSLDAYVPRLPSVDSDSRHRDWATMSVDSSGTYMTGWTYTTDGTGLGSEFGGRESALQALQAPLPVHQASGGRGAGLGLGLGV